MMRMTHILGCLALTLVLAGCERGMSDLRGWVEEMRQRPAQGIEPIPPIRTAEVVAYEAMEERDPFQRQTTAADEQAEESVDEGEGQGPRPDPDRRKEYLEGFPLDTLSMVGTLEIEGAEYALIQDNESVVHRVREGNYMGQNHGLVVAVQPDRVEVRELVQDGRGNWMERRVRVTMAE